MILFKLEMRKFHVGEVMRKGLESWGFEGGLSGK